MRAASGHRKLRDRRTPTVATQSNTARGTAARSRFFRAVLLGRCLQNRFQARDCEQVNRIKEGEAGRSCFDWSMQTDDETVETVGSLAIEAGIGL